MDAMEDFENPLKLNDQTKAYLLETAKWSKFFAILGFILCVLMIIFALFVGTIMGGLMAAANPAAANVYSGASGIFISVFYIALALVYMIPQYYRFKFANEAKLAINSDDDDLLESALGNQKSYYKFMGIFTIIFIALYAVLIVVALIGIAAFR